MPVTRIKNNQITDSTVNAAAKLQDYSITSGKISNNLTYGSSLTITGNLTVNGDVTTIDTVNLVVEDPLILLAKNQTSTPSLDIGFIGKRGSETNVAFVWDESQDEFVTAFTSSETTNTTISISSYASLRTFDATVGGNIAVTGTSNLTGNITVGNLLVDGQKTVDVGNSIISNLQTPSASSDAATKGYVDSVASTGFTIEDDQANTTVVSGGDTLSLLGTSNEVTVEITAADEVTFGLPDDVTIGNSITITDEVIAANLSLSGNVLTSLNVTGNITGGNLLTPGDIIATGDISGDNLTITTNISTGTLETTGNAVIGGNLVVQGNITYINIDDLRVEDPIIVLGTGPNGAPLTTDDGKDRGVFMEYYKSGARGNAFVGWDNSSGNMIIANDVEFSGNDVVQVNSYGILNVGNITGQTATLSGNITGGNIATTGTATIGTLTVTGNVETNLNVTGTVTAGTLVAVTNSNAATFNATTSVTTPIVTSTSGLTISTASNGNISINPNGTGVIILDDESANSVIYTGANKEITTDANLTFDGANLTVTGKSTFDNITIDGSDITGSGSEITINDASADINFRVEGATNANLFFVDAGTDTVVIGSANAVSGATLRVDATDSMIIPVGSTLDRPGTPVTGMLRFNTSNDAIEYYDADGWTSAGSTFTVITADTFTGNGVQTNFTLSSDSTTAATIVAINGVVQIPTTAYSVSGNVLSFTEAPESTDVIDARVLITTQFVTGIQNSSGNAVLEGSSTGVAFSVQGDLIPTADDTYDLGSPSVAWAELYSTQITTGDILNIGADGTGNIGNATVGFNTVFAKATSAQYADLAEMYEADAEYAPGTVVCFGGDKEVTLCLHANDRRVAGVISTNPSYLMNSAQQGEHVVAVALTGRVPCRVTGPVRKGDLMVSAGDGSAMTNNDASVGTVIGKSLEDFDGVSGVIEVVVGRI